MRAGTATSETQLSTSNPTTSNESQDDAVRLLGLIQGHWAAQVVGALARLRVVDHLDDGATNSSELAEATGADTDAIGRLLRASVSLGVLDQPEPDRFATTQLSAGLRANGTSYRELAIALTDPAVWRVWERLPDALLSGRSTASDALGGDLWEYFNRHPEERTRFAEAMGSLSARHTEAVLAAVEPSRFRRIVDVGGSHGALLRGLLKAAPAARGVLFDRPEIIEDARAAIAASSSAERLELDAGDFFEAVPQGGDLYVLKSVLLDWNDERAARILANCHSAAAPGASIWIVEALLPEPPQTSWVNLLDLNLLVLVGGRQRTLAEYEALLQRAGFAPNGVIELVESHALIEAVKR